MHILPCNYSVKAGHFFWHCSIRISYLLIISTFWSRELSWLFQDSMWVWKLSQRLALAARPDTPPLISDTEWNKCRVKMGNGSLSIFYQICWCTGHQTQSEKNSVKVKIFSNLCCPNLWGGSPVLLQFSLWNHLVDLKENKLIIWLMRAIMKFPICPFISFREVMSLSLQSLCCVWSRFSFLVREWKNVTDYCDYCDLVWVGAVGNIANPSPAPASYPII